MGAQVLYPYRFCGVTTLPLRYGQHCRIVKYDELHRSQAVVEFADGKQFTVDRMLLRLRDQYKRSEIHARV